MSFKNILKKTRAEFEAAKKLYKDTGYKNSIYVRMENITNGITNG